MSRIKQQIEALAAALSAKEQARIAMTESSVSRQRVQSTLRRGGHHSAVNSSAGYRVAEEGGAVVVRYTTQFSRYSEAYAATVRERLLEYQATLAQAGIPAHIPDSPGRIPWLICTPAPMDAE